MVQTWLEVDFYSVRAQTISNILCSNIVRIQQLHPQTQFRVLVWDCWNWSWNCCGGRSHYGDRINQFWKMISKSLPTWNLKTLSPTIFMSFIQPFPTTFSHYLSFDLWLLPAVTLGNGQEREDGWWFVLPCLCFCFGFLCFSSGFVFCCLLVSNLLCIFIQWSNGFWALFCVFVLWWYHPMVLSIKNLSYIL